MKRFLLHASVVFCAMVFIFNSALAQGTAFTYQGRLIDNGTRANGSYDLSFTLYDAASNGNLIGSAITHSAVTVSNGLFTTSLDFGASAFTNGSRWLAISERTNSGGNFTVLTPRQALTAAPYAVVAGTLAGSLPASQLSGTISLTQLSGAVLTNGASGVNLSGAFSGDGTGVTNVNLLNQNSFGAISDIMITTNLVYNGLVTASSPSVGSDPESVCAVDINGDGKLDLISANFIANTLTILTNNGSGGFVIASSLGVGLGPAFVCAADINGDGKVDLISANDSASTLTVLTNNGNGGFAIASSPAVGSSPQTVCTVDVNGDGKIDLISANTYANTLTVLTNNGSGGFAIASSPGMGSGPFSACAADVNGDGKIDLISANPSVNKLIVLTNNGSGGFVIASSPSVGNYPHSVCAADVNGDGKVDLICANYLANTLTVLTNNGNGGFVIASSPGVSGGPIFVCAADVNGDGKVDLFSANYSANTLTVLTNNGNGGFSIASSPGVGNEPDFICAADVNGDGKLDLISANASASTLTVLTNANATVVATKFTIAGNFTGNGAGLTNVNAANLIGNGMLPISVLPGAVVTNTETGITLSGTFAGTLNGSATLATNVVAGINITNAFITNSTFAGNGADLTNLNASQLASGKIAVAQLPTAVVTNGASGVTLSGTLTGNGAGLTNVNAANLTGNGTLPISVLPSTVVTNTEADVTLNGVFNGNAATATLATNVVAGINITNAFITNSVFAGNGAGLTNLNAAKLTGIVPTASLTAVPAASLTGFGTLPLSVLPSTVVTNTETGVTLNGTFAGNGSSLTNVNATSLGDSQISLASQGVVLGTNLNMASQAIYLKLVGDVNHGLGYTNSTTLFNGLGAPDGPMLWGYGGGALGFTDGGSKLALVWTKTGVGIGTNSIVAGHSIDTASGAYLTSAGVWTSVSDRNVKEDFTAIEPQAVLAKVAAMPITQWKYKKEAEGIKHIGPVAQDFYGAFGLGDSERAIGSIDEDGVALAAIQGLNQKLQQKDAEIQKLADQLKELQAAVKALQATNTHP